MLPTSVEIAWAAGLFEGEGSFTVARHKGYLHIVAELRMGDEDRVQEFHRILGVGNITAHRPAKVEWKTMYAWKTGSFEGVQHSIATLWRWLGPRRRARAKEILEAYKNYTNVRRFTLATPEEVSQVKQLLASGVPKRKIAATIGRSYGFVNHIKRGRTHAEIAPEVSHG